MYFSTSLLVSAVAVIIPSATAVPMPAPQKENVSGMCRVHIKQSATNWIDRVEVFNPSGASISKSWTDPKYRDGARAKAGMALQLAGYPHTVVIGGGSFEEGKSQIWNVFAKYGGDTATTGSNMDEAGTSARCSVGGWDNTHGGTPDLTTTIVAYYDSIHRQMDCYVKC